MLTRCRAASRCWRVASNPYCHPTELPPCATSPAMSPFQWTACPPRKQAQLGPQLSQPAHLAALLLTAPGRGPSRCTACTRPGWWPRCSAARRAPAWASAGWRHPWRRRSCRRPQCCGSLRGQAGWGGWGRGRWGGGGPGAGGGKVSDGDSGRTCAAIAKRPSVLHHARCAAAGATQQATSLSTHSRAPPAPPPMHSHPLPPHRR